MNVGIQPAKMVSQPLFGRKEGKNRWILGMAGALLSSVIGLSSASTLAEKTDSYVRHFVPASALKNRSPNEIPYPEFSPGEFEKMTTGGFKFDEEYNASYSVDLRENEINWDKKVGPFVDYMNLKFEEARQNGKVLIHRPAYVKDGKTGEDGGRGPSLHETQAWFTTLDDDTEVAMFKNVYWPQDPESGLLNGPDLERIRIVYKRKDDKDATTIFHQHSIYWADNGDGLSLGKYQFFPFIVKQHHYSREKDDNGMNFSLQTKHPASSPINCYGCHEARSSDTDDWRQTLSITDLKDYFDPQKPASEQQSLLDHPGTKGYLDNLQGRVDRFNKLGWSTRIGITLPQDFEEMKKILADPASLRTTYLLEALRDYENPKRSGKIVDWVEGDTPYNMNFWVRQGRHAVDSYKDNGKYFEPRGYTVNASGLDAMFHGGLWWFANELTALPYINLRLEKEQQQSPSNTITANMEQPSE